MDSLLLPCRVNLPVPAGQAASTLDGMLLVSVSDCWITSCHTLSDFQQHPFVILVRRSEVHVDPTGFSAQGVTGCSQGGSEAAFSSGGSTRESCASKLAQAVG